MSRSPRRRRSPRLSWVAAALGALLVAAGAVLFTLANRPDGVISEGSYAQYRELDSASAGDWHLSFGDGWAVSWTAGHVWGAGLVVLGLLVLAGLGGWLLGRRSASRSGGPAR